MTGETCFNGGAPPMPSQMRSEGHNTRDQLQARDVAELQDKLRIFADAYGLLALRKVLEDFLAD